jgi:hypothetical protein
MPRRAGRLEKVLHEVDGVVQKIFVIGAYIDVKLPLQLRPQGIPVALQNPCQ